MLFFIFPSYFSLQDRGKGDIKQRYEAEVKLFTQGQNDSMGEQTPNHVLHCVNILGIVPP